MPNTICQRRSRAIFLAHFRVRALCLQYAPPINHRMVRREVLGPQPLLLTSRPLLLPIIPVMYQVRYHRLILLYRLARVRQWRQRVIQHWHIQQSQVQHPLRFLPQRIRAFPVHHLRHCQVPVHLICLQMRHLEAHRSSRQIVQRRALLCSIVSIQAGDHLQHRHQVRLYYRQLFQHTDPPNIQAERLRISQRKNQHKAHRLCRQRRQRLLDQPIQAHCRPDRQVKVRVRRHHCKLRYCLVTFLPIDLQPQCRL
mmetsp:Transcript_28353/g.62290  ORF Transcript_28353/g.62290 Transcript_28353/m.62290 type:complete len:254 (-) Transcript_28353:2515-3276(-)